MNTSTLRGIFPEPKPVYRRNFVRENIKHLKQMQGYVQPDISAKEIKADKFKHIAPRVFSNISSFRRTGSREDRPVTFQTKNPRSALPKSKSELRSVHRSVQTERPEDMTKLYETGVLKYPTQHRPKEHGDTAATTTTNINKNLQKLNLDGKHNFIKENARNVKGKEKREGSPDPNLPPPTYQKGALPKYLKERKADVKPVEFIETESIPGLILLPDEERKEYLRVARENYAGLIKELNSMPVSNDTLKRRKRKIEIEEELKRLDEVIKIFQKPKVFVKADA